MHIHPPKPLHGWKEFLNEIVIIVIGVLIALGFEQVVEELHWQHKVHDGEVRLRAEASVNTSFAAELIAKEPCVAAQISELVERVRSSGDRLTPSPVTKAPSGPSVVAAGTRPFQSGVWAALGQDGTQNHFDPTRQKRLGLVYSGVDSIRAYNQNITAAQGRLLVLADPVPLDAGSRLHLLESLHDLAKENAYRALLAAQLVNNYQQAGIEPDERFITEHLTKIAQLRPDGQCTIGSARLADWKAKVAEQAKTFAIYSKIL